MQHLHCVILVMCQARAPTGFHCCKCRSLCAVIVCAPVYEKLYIADFLFNARCFLCCCPPEPASLLVSMHHTFPAQCVVSQNKAFKTMTHPSNVAHFQNLRLHAYIHHAHTCCRQATQHGSTPSTHLSQHSLNPEPPCVTRRLHKALPNAPPPLSVSSSSPVLPTRRGYQLCCSCCSRQAPTPRTWCVAEASCCALTWMVVPYLPSVKGTSFL